VSGKSDELEDGSRADRERVAFAHLEHVSGYTRKTLREVWTALHPKQELPDFGYLSDYSDEETAAFFKSLSDIQLSELELLTTMAAVGENQYMSHTKEELQQAREFFGEKGVHWKETEAQMALELAAKKYKPRFEAHLQAPFGRRRARAVRRPNSASQRGGRSSATKASSIE
jgi:hypothetical protein